MCLAVRKTSIVVRSSQLKQLRRSSLSSNVMLGLSRISPLVSKGDLFSISIALKGRSKLLSVYTLPPSTHQISLALIHSLDCFNKGSLLSINELVIHVASVVHYDDVFPLRQ